MKDVPIEDPDVEDLGPAMLALDPRQRRFVIGWIRTRGKNAARVAAAAGYSTHLESHKVQACRLLRKATTLAAIKEEADRRLDSVAVLALLRLEDIVENPEHSDHLKAVDSLLDRGGYSRKTQHSVNVQHTDSRSTAELLEAVRGLLPAPPKVIEGEFHQVAMKGAVSIGDE